MSAGFEGRRVLVVGGAGFVGSNLSHALLGHDPAELIIVDNLLSAVHENVPQDERVTFVRGSINDSEILSALPEDLDYAFHLATYHGNQSSIHDPIADHEHNTLTSLKLFHRLTDLPGLARVVYAGAGCTVAAKTSDAPEATEEEEYVSLYLDSPYQVSKIIGELYGNYFFMRNDLPVVKARFQNVYGPREVLGAGQWRGTPATVWRNVVPTFIYKALTGQALPIHGNGSATRDFIFVDDIVEGLIACALEGRPGGVYNLASGLETPIGELAARINELAGNATRPTAESARSWDRSGRRFGATEKSEREIGFRARTPLDEGLAATVAWTRDNLAFIDRCIDVHRERVPELIGS